ncbi:MAG: carboxypeptidase M32, partial [Candidatus Hydrogenedentes bacterium]|nr:carboxypeptidase M32 [Candidatus Hydrogenedentota bacterium]
RHYLPILQEAFPERLKNVQPEQVYQAVNRVEHSLIRVEADECTYNLHVILRFEIEVGLIEGTLSVDDVPDAWNAKVKEYLGLDVPDDAHGCLQDIHWSHGAFGYFPTYALGNLYAAQLFETIVAAIPDLWTQVDRGEFAPLLGWLRENIHRHGRRKLPLEILKDATGKDPDWRPYLKYLEEKYGALYDLDAECSES